jgi:hypothetical protein
MENEKIEVELVNSVVSANITNLSADILELGLDSFLQNGIVKDIPFFGAFVKIYGAQKEIRNQLFLKKVAQFLFALKETNDIAKIKFLEEMNSSVEKKRSFGEAVILLIDKAEDMLKPYFIGRIMKAYIENKIEYVKAMRICKMIERAYSPDVYYLKDFREGIQKEKDIAASLCYCGFLSDVGIDGGTFEPDSGGTIYAMNEYGKLFLQYGIADK